MKGGLSWARRPLRMLPGDTTSSRAISRNKMHLVQELSDVRGLEVSHRVVDGGYNPDRPHQELGYSAPAEYRKRVSA